MNALGFLLAAVLTVHPSGDLATQIRSAPSHTWIGVQLPRGHSDECGCSGPVNLYFHIVDRHVDRLKANSATCRPFDSHGEPVELIDGTAESAVDNALIEFARHDPSASVRKEAIFWLSVEAGEKAAGALKAAADDDPDTRVKEAAVFGLSMLPDDEGVPMLIDVANHHSNREVRKKAIFWLGQKHDPRALEALVEIVRR